MILSVLLFRAQNPSNIPSRSQIQTTKTRKMLGSLCSLWSLLAKGVGVAKGDAATGDHCRVYEEKCIGVYAVNEVHRTVSGSRSPLS